MTVFNTFWKVVKKYKGIVILYTVILIVFGGINMQSNSTQTTYTDSKPDIIIVNEDENKGLTKNLIDYLKSNTKLIKVKDTDSARDDAIFYRDASYIIYIPKNYRKDVLALKNPTLKIKSAANYDSSLTEMMLKRYLKVQSIYTKYYKNEEELIKAINTSLKDKTTVNMTSKVDTLTTSEIARYFNFSSYSIMAVIIYIICIVLASFNELKIKKRTIISSMNYQKHNSNILLASSLYALLVWLLYVVLGVIIFKGALFNLRGLIYILNTLIFTISALTLSLLLATLINDKNAISGVVNVVALGSAFLCGAFVPTKLLPESVLKIAHILPTYWYINSNDLLIKLETISLETLKPILINSLVLILFSLLFIILNNLVTKRKQKIG